MQFRSRFFDLLFNLAQSKTVSPTLVPIDFIVDDMKVETVVSGDLVQICCRVSEMVTSSPRTAKFSNR